MDKKVVKDLKKKRKVAAEQGPRAPHGARGAAAAGRPGGRRGHARAVVNC